MKPISEDIRKLIIVAKQRKEKNKDISHWLCISESSVNLIWSLYKKTSSISPTAYTGRQSQMSQELIDKILFEINQDVDTTLESLIEKLQLPIQKSQLHRLLVKCGYTHKKKRYILKHNNEKM